MIKRFLFCNEAVTDFIVPPSKLFKIFSERNSITKLTVVGFLYNLLLSKKKILFYFGVLVLKFRILYFKNNETYKHKNYIKNRF